MQSVLVRERDVDPLLESAEKGRVKFPRAISSTKEEERRGRGGDSFHLREELSLDSPGAFLFVGTPLAANAVYFINKDNLEELKGDVYEYNQTSPEVSHV